MTKKQRASGLKTRTQILDTAVMLFAKAGYSGVSMREIAHHVNITPAALYHHFGDKQSLHLAAMAHIFADKAEQIIHAVNSPGTAKERLIEFVQCFTELMANDPNFRKLLQRELLDGDETRLKLLSDQVFAEAFSAVASLATELAPDCDPHLLVISMAGLVLFHFETAPLRQFLPGGQPQHDEPKAIANHVSRLLLRALEGHP